MLQVMIQAPFIAAAEEWRMGYTDLDSYAGRLKHLLEVRGIPTAVEAASIISKGGGAATSKAIGLVLSGQTHALNAVNHSVLCAELRCSALWLATGKGPAPTREDKTSARVVDFPRFDPAVERVQELMRGTDAKGRARCLEAVAVALAAYGATQSTRTSGE